MAVHEKTLPEKCCANCKWYQFDTTREYQEGNPKDIFCCRNTKTEYYGYARDYDFSCDEWKSYLDSKMENSTMKDVVNHPKHYETGKYECFDVMREALGDEAVKDFCICNAFKYLYRHRRKNGAEDIEKAIWYLEKWQELQEESDGEQR